MREVRRYFGQLFVLILALVGLVWLLAICAPDCLAQSNPYLTDVGVPLFTTSLPVEKGFINVANGNMHLEIPVGSFRQRGSQDVTAFFVYDSRIWEYGPPWQPYNVYDPGGSPGNYNIGQSGWRFVTSAHHGIPGYMSDTYYCYSNEVPPVQYAVTIFHDFSWAAPDGTVVPLYGARTVNNQSNGLCGDDADSPTGSGWSGASGYLLTVTNYTQMTILAPDGIQVLNDTTYNPSRREDANGNYIDYVPVTFNYPEDGDPIDTLGRVPITYVPNGPNCNTTFCFTILNSQGTTSTIKITTQSINVSTALGGYEYNGTITGIQRIDLPDGSNYQFQYDSGTSPGHYGVLTSMTLPTGGQVSYGYSVFQDAMTLKNLWITSRTSGGGSWTYTPRVLSSVPCPCHQQVTVAKPDGSTQVYSFLVMGYGSWPTQIDYYNGPVSPANWLETTTATWDTVNQLKTMETTTLPLPGGTNISSSRRYTYDAATLITSNVAKTEEWNFYMGALPATPDRIIWKNFTSANASYLNKNIIDGPTSVSVSTAGGTTLAQTNYSYDSTSMTSLTGTTHHDDANFGTSNTIRGNLTQTQKWTGSAYLTTTHYYDTTGQKLKTVDPLSNQTINSYSDCFRSDNGANPPASYTPPAQTNAYLTQTILPLSGSLRNCYYFQTGQLAHSQDQNGATTYLHYLDPWDRPTHAYFPDGGWNLTQYSSATQVDLYTAITDATPSTSCVGCRHDRSILDGLGRAMQAVLVSDPDGADFTDTGYDTNGRILSISNPHRSASLPTDGSQITAYDGLDRPIQITRQDGSVAYRYYGPQVGTHGGASSQLCSSATYGLGYPILHVDEAGKKRQTWTDGFGRLIEVDEPDSSGNLTVPTCYQYDRLNNPTQVVQGSRTRSFTYDPLSRLTSATNPESGTTNYFYTTAAGGLCSGDPASVCRRTDARGITTTYSYDALNRVTQKTYSDGTLTAYFAYEQTSAWGTTLTNTLGRLTEQWTGTSCCATGGAEIFSYDPMGRVLLNTQYAPAMSYRPMNYTYDLAGNTHTFTDGVGETYTQTFNTASRVTQLSSSWVDSQHPAVMASGISYNPAGTMRQITYGNSLVESAVYNNRLQPCRYNVNSSGNILGACGDAIPSGTVQDFTYGFNAGTANNGNLATWSAVGQQAFNRSYTYDLLNRIATMNDSNTGQACRGLSWTIDSWGNRTDQTVTAGTCRTFHQAVDTNNRLLGAPYQYDTARNLTNDGSHTYTYDAENRLTQVDNGSTAAYVYDAEGRRIQKTVGSNQTDYIYDLSGNVASELNSSSWLNAYLHINDRLFAQYTLGAPRTEFIHTDHLGSTRLVTSFVPGTPPTFAVYDNIDYLPFGEQISGDTATTHKFTGKERDSESGLDNFGARYNSSSMGRFMSPDPLGGHLEDPQTLNRYSYVRNNPLSLTDPTGLDFALTCDKETETETCHNGFVGTYTDKNGKRTFTGTVIGNDENGNLVDKTTGTGFYTGTVDGSGVQFTKQGSNTASTGVWVKDSPETKFTQTSGALAGFSFDFRQTSKEQTANGTFFYPGAPRDAYEAILKAGFSASMADDFFNPLHGYIGSYHYRSDGEPGTGKNSGHVIIRGVGPWHPWDTVPTRGDLHFGETNPNVNRIEHFRRDVF